LPNTNLRLEQILDDMLSIIVAEGFSHLTVAVLAERLHCSRTTLYRIAPSKDALVLTVLERLADGSFAEAKGAAAVPGLSQAERISQWIQVVSLWQGKVSTACWLDVSRWQPSAELFARKNDRALGYLGTFIEEGIRTGEFRPANARFAAEMLSRGSLATRDPIVLKATGLTSGEAVAQLGVLILKGLEQA
jgi:AcrR family transcriptional regulator